MPEDILQKMPDELFRRELVLRIQALCMTILSFQASYTEEQLEDLMLHLVDVWTRRGPD